jgi:SPP1 gp7 family putative phage head morphogenesis protein
MPGEEKPPAKQSLAFDPGEHDIGRRAAWQVFHDQTMEHEGRVKKLALRVFGGYIDKAIALARDLAAEGKTFAWNGAVSHQIDENELHLLLPDIGPWQERMSDALMPALRDVLEQQARYIADAAGAEVLITRADPAALQFLTAKEIQIRETLPTLRAAIKSVLERALSDNATVGTLADQIRQALEMYRSDLKVMQDSLGSRAELIARTETTSVANGARMMEAERQGIVEMRWISSRDAFVRESHAALDGSVRPVGEVFGYGLKFPGDPDAPVGEIANCRCTVAPTARSAQAKGEAA